MSAPEMLTCEVRMGSDRVTCGDVGVAMVREPHTANDLWPICRRHVGPDYDLVSLASYVRTQEAEALRAAVVDELEAQAEAIRQRIRTHGLGMRHGCDTGRSNYCEAWRLVLADIEARARALASPTVTTQHDTTNEENPCSTRP